MTRVIVDTGPLVALLNAGDAHHAWARDTLESVQAPMLACESVLSEACFLVRKLPGGIEAVLGLVDRGVVEVPFRLADEFAHVRRLMVRFRNVPMSLADACLVRMAEQHPDRSILTCDRDFAIYRLRGGRVPRLVAPFG